LNKEILIGNPKKNGYSGHVLIYDRSIDAKGDAGIYLSVF